MQVAAKHARCVVTGAPVEDSSPLMTTPTESTRHFIEVLEELVTIRRSVSRLEFVVVALVRATGASWEDVGEALGLSRQAAARKYGRPRKRLI